jgi:hypothetical protein
MKIHCAHDAEVAIADLKPNPANPNKHPDSQIALLAKIIKAQGWRNPIVVSNRSGLITKGHGRLAAALMLGATHAPVDYQDYASAMEIDPGYVAVSIQRWADATGKTPKLLTSFPNQGKDAKKRK